MGVVQVTQPTLFYSANPTIFDNDTEHLHPAMILEVILCCTGAYVEIKVDNI